MSVVFGSLPERRKSYGQDVRQQIESGADRIRCCGDGDIAIMRNKRLLSLAVACLRQGSSDPQYAYSAWAPQFATKMKLSKTESNLIVSCVVASSEDIKLNSNRVHSVI